MAPEEGQEESSNTHGSVMTTPLHALPEQGELAPEEGQGETATRTRPRSATIPFARAPPLCQSKEGGPRGEPRAREKRMRPENFEVQGRYRL